MTSNNSLLARATAAAYLEPGAQSRYHLFMRRLPASARARVTQYASQLKVSRRRVTEAEMTRAVKARFPGNLPQGDIMALVFLVMMEASHSMREDLKSFIEEAKRENERKRQLALHGKVTEPAWPPRGIRTAAVSSGAAAPAVSFASLTTEPASRSSDYVDALGGMSLLEVDLQKYMDAFSQVTAMISNVLRRPRIPHSRWSQTLSSRSSVSRPHRPSAGL
jgi:hypothetical protein